MGDDRIGKLTMPQWGFSMTQGRVVEWLVAEGAEISAGDEILEVESEKAVGVVESPLRGILRRRVAVPGQQIPVGGLLAVVADSSVSDAEIDRFVASFVVEEFRDEADTAVDEPKMVEVDGRTLRFLKRGEGDSPVVLIHGFAGNLNNWLFNQQELAAHRAVYAVDLPGHGQSSKDVGDGSLETLADVICAWLDAIGIKNTHVVGHSLGGGIALLMALKNPTRLRSCTLLAGTALGPEINSEIINGIVASDRRKKLKSYLERLFADPSLVTRQLVDDVLKFKRIDGVQEALRRVATKLADGNQQPVVLRDRLNEISLPMLVVWGEQDQVLPRSHAEGLPDSWAVEVVAGSGHMVQMESAHDINRLIADFLQNCDEDTAG